MKVDIPDYATLQNLWEACLEFLFSVGLAGSVPQWVMYLLSQFDFLTLSLKFHIMVEEEDWFHKFIFLSVHAFCPPVHHVPIHNNNEQMKEFLLMWTSPCLILIF